MDEAQTESGCKLFEEAESIKLSKEAESICESILASEWQGKFVLMAPDNSSIEFR